jgi:HEAT repeat protein
MRAAACLVPLVVCCLVHCVPRRAPAQADPAGPVVEGKPLSHWLAAAKAESSVVRREAIRVLSGVRPTTDEVIAALAGALTDDREPTVRGEAAAALGVLGRAAGAATPALVKALRDAAASVRGQAALGLGRVAPDPAVAVPALAAAVRDDDRDVRARAIDAIAAFGAAGRPAVPALVEALRDKSIAHFAVRALGAIGSAARDNRDCGPALIELASTAGGDLLTETARSLGRIGGDDALLALLGMLRQEAAERRLAAFEGLRRSDDANPQVIAALLKALRDDEPAVRECAAAALTERKLAEDARLKTAVTALIGGRLSDADVQVLLKLGRAAVPGLADALLDRSRPAPVRADCAVVLGRIGRAAVDGVPALVRTLADPEAGVRLVSAEALLKIAAADRGGPGRRPSDGLAVPHELSAALATALDSREAEVRECAAVLLGRVGRPEAAAVTALAGALRDVNVRVRRAAATALRATARHARPVAPVVVKLTEALRDGDDAVRLRAVETLGLLGAAAEPAVPELEELTDDPEVGDAARDALEAIRKAAAAARPGS